MSVYMNDNFLYLQLISIFYLTQDQVKIKNKSGDSRSNQKSSPDQGVTRPRKQTSVFLEKSRKMKKEATVKKTRNAKSTVRANVTEE